MILKPPPCPKQNGPSVGIRLLGLVNVMVV